MKKTLKIGMLAAAAVLMVLTGCKNSFAPTYPSEDSFKAEVTRINSAYNAFSITGVTHDFYGNSNKEKSQVTITFSKDVTVDGVKNGVRFYKLTDATENWTMPKKAPLTVYDIKVDGTNAYFTVDTKDVHYLYVFVTAAETKAESGASLNQDGDNEWAEKHDDDVAYYEAIGTSTTLKGDYNVEKTVSSIDTSGKFVGDNTTLSTLFNPKFKLGSDSSDQLVTTVEVAATTFNGALWLGKMDDSGNAVFNDAEKNTARSTAAGLLTKHLKAEYYNWKESKWVTVDLSFSYKEIEANASTGITAFKGWRSDITLAPNRQIRFKWVDTKDMKMELKTYGYPIKYSLNGTDADSRVKVVDTGIGNTESGFLYDFTNRTWPGAVTADTATTGKVTLTLQVPASAVGFGNHKYSASDKTGYKVTETNPEWTLTDQKKSLFAGFAASAADHPAYFKCFDSSDQEIAIEKASLLQSSVDTYPEAWDQLVIYFKDSTKQAAKVYISPEVTSAAFKGSYVNNEGKRVAIDIPSLSLADVNANDDPNVLGGWLQK